MEGTTLFHVPVWPDAAPYELAETPEPVPVVRLMSMLSDWPNARPADMESASAHDSVRDFMVISL
jgi:hypothetical protein